MIPGFSVQNGITMTMQDKTGGDLNKFFQLTQSFLQELNKREEIQTAMTTYNPNYPQYMVDVDVAKAKQAGISPTAVLATLQGYLGGMYASNFNAYGKDRKSTRPELQSRQYLVCRLLLEKKKKLSHS